jgi:hypothetical protein
MRLEASASALAFLDEPQVLQRVRAPFAQSASAAIADRLD